MLQLPEPRKVRAFSDDATYAFVEGSDTGIPIGQLTVVEEKLSQAKTAPAPATLGVTTFNQQVYTLGTEGKVILQWPEKISQESYEELSDWIDLQLKKIAALNRCQTETNALNIMKSPRDVPGFLLTMFITL